MIDICWREKYLIGIPEIDKEHELLFSAMALNVSELILNKDNIESCFSPKNIGELLSHIKQHYENEEIWMERYQYPQKEVHQEQHKISLLKIEEMASLIAELDFKSSISFYMQVLENLDNHILEYDKKLGLYYQKLKA